MRIKKFKSTHVYSLTPTTNMGQKKKKILKAKWLATNKRKEGRKVRRQKRSTIIPSCIAKLVTSTVLKFCNSRACQWLVRVSKFPMAALESKTIWLRFQPSFFAFAFKHSTFRSWETKQPSSPVLTWRLGQNSPARPQIRKPDMPGLNVWHQKVSWLGLP